MDGQEAPKVDTGLQRYESYRVPVENHMEIAILADAVTVVPKPQAFNLVKSVCQVDLDESNQVLHKCTRNIIPDY